MESTYMYRPLDPAKKEIRLLRLLPGAWESPIECETFAVSLADQPKPKYAALSYVWGSNLNQQLITLDRYPFRVGWNLFTALRRMRAHNNTEAGITWADAICINQTDDIEKGWQVAMMGDIYKSCAQVHIWLGELAEITSEPGRRCVPFSCNNADFSEPWTNYLSDLGLKPAGVKIPDFSVTNVPETSHIDIIFHLAWFIRLIIAGEHIAKLPPFFSETAFNSDYRHRFHEAVKTVMNNPYFSRMWIVQETALPPSALVLFSAYTFPLKELTNAFYTIQSHREQKCCEPQSDGCLQVWDSLRVCLLRFRTITSHRERFQTQERINIFSLCMMHATRQSKERVDRVYAMLSLVTDWYGPYVPENSIVPDYSYFKADSKAEAEAVITAIVYAQVSKDFLTKSGGFLKFPLITSPFKPKLEKLPSWAMDWETFSDSKSTGWDKQVFFYNAHGGWTAKCAITREDVLITPAFQRATIIKIGNLQADYANDDATNALLDNWKELLPNRELLNAPYPGGGTWSSAWWRTLSGDCWPASNGAIRRITEGDVNLLANAVNEGQLGNFRASLDNGQRISPQPQTLYTASASDLHLHLLIKVHILGMLPRRRLFITDSGYLGFGREDIEVGDGVFILPGAYAPCILRRTEQKFVFGGHEASGYKAIGGCYLHGVMDGEAVRGRNENDDDVFCIA